MVRGLKVKILITAGRELHPAPKIRIDYLIIKDKYTMFFIICKMFAWGLFWHKGLLLFASFL